jgi:hypothetical protein
MPAIQMCTDCISLVGAGRNQEPHRELLPMVEPADPADLFKCSACDSRWIVGKLGWSRYVS